MARRPLQMIALAMAAVLAVAAAARADYRISGHGYGHGVGMSQYGALGVARETRHTYRWILSHYFPGTRRATVPSAPVRVRLKVATAARVTLASLATDARGRQVRLRGTHVYRFVPWSDDGLEIQDRSAGVTRAHVHAPVRISGPDPLRVIGLAENGVTDGRYRGAIVLERDAAQVLVVDRVWLESYLRGVVPAEMPAAWPAQALRSQAVVARSYALTSRRPAEPFDVYADTRSQAYRGVTGEAATTDDAVRATGGIVLTYGSAVARTLFHSSSGGRTASAQEIFGGAPVPYEISVDDPYDRISPYHDWTVVLTDAEVAEHLAPVLLGDLVDIQVVALSSTGRAATVRVVGTLGSVDVPGTRARSLLGLRSSWFAATRARAGSCSRGSCSSSLRR